jgi:hypothetical protein
MQTLSLHVKLRNLLDSGILSLKSDPELGHVLPGEGSYYFGEDKIEILSGVRGKLPGEADVTLTIPSDVAWVPRTCMILAHAPTDTGPFEVMPAQLRKMVADFKHKNKNSIN